MRSLQQTKKQWPRWALPLWAVLAVAAALILWLSPTEHTLGQGIKWVYIHLAFIWTAMLGMLVVGILSLIQVFASQAAWRRWGDAAGWATLGTLILALIGSLVVMQVNWGGISWDEPRTQSLMRTLAIWVLVQFASPWISNRHVRGLLTTVLVAVALIPMRYGPLVIHPQNPLGTSSSNAIRLASVALFGVVLVAGASATWVIRQRQES